MRRAIATLLTLCALAAPVEAAEYAMANPWRSELAAAQTGFERPARPEPKSPAMAAALTIGAPIVLAGGLKAATAAASIWSQDAPITVIGLSSIAAGHIYAGDPWRGVLVAGGFPLAMGAGLGLGFGLSAMMGERNGYAMLGTALITGTLATLGYMGWAAADAYQTAERRNFEDGLGPVVR